MVTDAVTKGKHTIQRAGSVVIFSEPICMTPVGLCLYIARICYCTSHMLASLSIYSVPWPPCPSLNWTLTMNISVLPRARMCRRQWVTSLFCTLFLLNEPPLLRRHRIPIRIMVPPIDNAPKEAAPANVPTTVLALIGRLSCPSAPVLALGAEECLWQASVRAEIPPIAARLLRELKPRAQRQLELLLIVRVSVLRIIAVPLMLAADVTEFFAAGTANGGDCVSAKWSLCNYRQARRVSPYSGAGGNEYRYLRDVVASLRLLHCPLAHFTCLPPLVHVIVRHGLLLEVLLALADVRVSSAEGAGASPAGLAEADVGILVNTLRGNVFPATTVAAEELVSGGVVLFALLHHLRDVWEEDRFDLRVVEVESVLAA